MSGQTVEIKTKNGAADCEFFSPPTADKRPGVILYMDVFGVRPALSEMAQRLASNGYHVLLPNLYYRVADAGPFDPATSFQAGPERARMMAARESLTNARVMDDTGYYLAFLESQATFAGKVGCVGYCMGGPYALLAAGTYPNRVRAAASMHGTRLATDQPDSPHLLAGKIKGEIYVGIAEHDQHFITDEKQRLETALTSAGVVHTLEVYPGVKHGFAVNRIGVYDQAAAEQHWARIISLFARNLAA